MESWLAADTIRRMGFGHVVAARHHTLIVERGVSFVAFDGSGRPLRSGYRVTASSRRSRATSSKWGVVSLIHELCRGAGCIPARTRGWYRCLRLVLAPSIAHAAETTAAELVRRRCSGYDSIKDFSADFVHTLSGRRAPQTDLRARPRAHQETGQDAVGLHGAREEAVRLRRRAGSIPTSPGQTGHGQRAAARRPDHGAGAVSRRQGQPDARLHAVARWQPAGLPARAAGR